MNGINIHNRPKNMGVRNYLKTCDIQQWVNSELYESNYKNVKKNEKTNGHNHKLQTHTFVTGVNIV